jgi:predicted outer membrane repeat protein
MDYLNSRLRKPIAALAAFVALVAASAGHAATITVHTTADPGGGSDCSLRFAMAASIAKVPIAGCPAGSGDDSIVFGPGVTGTIALSAGLPALSSGTLAIVGPGGAAGITIDGTKVETVFSVNSRGALRLSKLTVVNANDTAVANVGAELTIDQCTFSHNRGETTGGGAIFVSAGSTTITASTFSANSSTVTDTLLFGGGAIFARSPPGTPNTLTITASTFDQNSSDSDGGAILTVNSAVTIVNSTFARNSAQAGGGAIWDSGSEVFVTNSTFSKNLVGSGFGGAVHVAEAVSLSLKGSILAGKAGGNCFGAISDAGYNISDDGSCGFSGTSRNNLDPKLDAAGPANNGGPTPTIALTVGSPAVDAIPIASCTDQASPPQPLATDQRGAGRPDAEDAGKPACDIGAYELIECAGAFPSVPTVFPPNGKFVAESVLGASGVTITGILQDEPIRKCPVATGVGTGTARVRAERDDRRGGRTYHLRFRAAAATIGGTCLGEVKVCVPHDRAHVACTDAGALFDSTCAAAILQ